jgi:signal transduction histidine kinase/DNA-binding response OmpR family regulator
MIKERSKILLPLLFIFSFIVVLAVSFYANSLISFSMRTMEDNIEQRLMATSEWLARFVTIEELDQYHTVEDMNLAEYRALRLRLLEFSGEADVLYAYYLRPVGDGLHFQYIADNDFDEETRVGLDTTPHGWDVEPWLKTALEGHTVCSGLRTETPGLEAHLLTSYSPMFNDHGEVAFIAGVDIEDEIFLWASRMVRVLTLVQIIAVAAIFVSGLIGLVFFRRQAEIAGEANAAKSRFLSQMSHEIRTPLNAVIGLSEIELRNELPPSSRDNIERIHQSGSYLLGIIGDILDISKIEAGNFDLVPVEYETASLINDTINLNRVRIGSRAITFILEISGDFPRKLRGDELRVKQILNNLLSNAVKYTQEGKVTLSVEFENLNNSETGSRSMGNKGLLRFTVRDTGIGIRPEDMEKLFSSYTQLDTGANRKIEGTGLGLTIAKRLVEMMDGRVTVESEYGKGSVFTAEIVQGIDDYESIGEAAAENLRNFHYTAESKEADIAYLQMPGTKALVVDDIATNLLVAQGLLEPYGMRVDAAASGREAIEMSKTESYDIVFMDHMMPEMDGVEALAALREIKAYTDTPVIALTANALHGMKEYYLEQGFQDYLSKPMDPLELDEVLKRWVKTGTGDQGARLESIARNQHALITNNDPSPQSPIPSPFLIPSPIEMELEAQRLDMLKHYRVSFEHGRDFDSEYFKRFTELIQSLKEFCSLSNIDPQSPVPDPQSHNLQEQAVLLAEAGRRGDARTIRETLPAFCEALRSIAETRKSGEENAEPQEILARLKMALLAGGADTVEAIIREMGAARLPPAGRELYIKLYELLLTGETEKALEVINEECYD